MPKARLRIADEFVYDIAAITSEKVPEQIRGAVNLLADNPEMGSPIVRQSLEEPSGKACERFRLPPSSSSIAAWTTWSTFWPASTGHV